MSDSWTCSFKAPITSTPLTSATQYYLEASRMDINADGVVNPYGKVFNKTYPGPWIRRLLSAILSHLNC